ncbi:MAG: hypothetical protein QG578_167 [Thermodesulfobacteriota bacterium]|nr:hypothetical protein [Thermodesulfobacteriota bacterium]
MKTVELNGSVGSNPTPSAITIRRDCREAEGARLLSECGAKVPPRVRIPLSPPNRIFLFTPYNQIHLTNITFLNKKGLPYNTLLNS